MSEKEEAKQNEKYLKEFLNNNHELERLDSIVNEFNIFTALSISTFEIRHSTFLAWLLNPKETHGLSDYFLKSFIKSVLFNTENSESEIPSIFEVDSYDLSNCEVVTEWRNIDVFIHDRSNKFVCAIENKINSKEHSNQLNKYELVVKRDFGKNYKKLFIYLTVEGEMPSNEVYQPTNYSNVSKLIDSLIENKRDKLNEDIILFIEHYSKMLKRFIMKESEIQKISRSIYKTHRKALDIIFENKPDVYLNVYEKLVEIIEDREDMILDESSKSFIRFIPSELSNIPLEGNGWTKTKRLLLYEIKNTNTGLDLYLTIGPGNADLRQKIYEVATVDKKLFNKVTGTLYGKWNTIYKKNISKMNNYEDLEGDDLKSHLSTLLINVFDTSMKEISNKLVDFNVEKNGH